MEVLDTTIANVALRYIAGGLSAANVDSEWVITSLSRGECDHSADFGLARDAARQAELFSGLDRSFYPGLRPVWDGHQPGFHNRRARFAGGGWRWVAAFEPGHLAGRFPSREAGAGHDGLRTGGAAGASRRAYTGRLYNRQLWLALDLLFECSSGPVGIFHVPGARAGSGISAGRAARKPSASGSPSILWGSVS